MAQDGDLKRQFGAFMRTAVRGIDSVREVVVKKSREGKIQIDVAMLKRKRREALADLGAAVAAFTSGWLRMYSAKRSPRLFIGGVGTRTKAPRAPAGMDRSAPATRSLASRPRADPEKGAATTASGKRSGASTAPEAESPSQA